MDSTDVAIKNQQSVANKLSNATCHKDLYSFMECFDVGELKGLFQAEIDKINDMNRMNRIFLRTQSINVILPTDILNKTFTYLTFWEMNELRIISAQFNATISSFVPKYTNQYLSNHGHFKQIVIDKKASLNGSDDKNKQNEFADAYDWDVESDEEQFGDLSNYVGIWLHNKYNQIHPKHLYGVDEFINALYLKFRPNMEFIGTFRFGDDLSTCPFEKYIYVSKLKDEKRIEMYQGSINGGKDAHLVDDWDAHAHCFIYDKIWKNKTTNMVKRSTFDVYCDDCGYSDLSDTYGVAVLCVLKFEDISSLFLS